MSRNFNFSTEWMITDKVFKLITQLFGKPEIDMFASRINNKLEKYVSWKQEPQAIAIDAFTLNWFDTFIYCFPPFSMVSKVLTKITRERTEAVVVVPLWTTQNWYPVLNNMMIDCPLVVTSSTEHLLLPTHPTQVHPLHPRLRMVIAHVSGKKGKIISFRQKLMQYCWQHGDPVPKQDTKTYCTNGNHFVSNGITIPYIQL